MQASLLNQPIFIWAWLSYVGLIKLHIQQAINLIVFEVTQNRLTSSFIQ